MIPSEKEKLVDWGFRLAQVFILPLAVFAAAVLRDHDTRLAVIESTSISNVQWQDLELRLDKMTVDLALIKHHLGLDDARK